MSEKLTEQERELLRLLGMMRPLLNRDGLDTLHRLERRSLRPPSHPGNMR